MGLVNLELEKSCRAAVLQETGGTLKSAADWRARTLDCSCWNGAYLAIGTWRFKSSQSNCQHLSELDSILMNYRNISHGVDGRVWDAEAEGSSPSIPTVQRYTRLHEL